MKKVLLLILLFFVGHYLKAQQTTGQKVFSLLDCIAVSGSVVYNFNPKPVDGLNELSSIKVPVLGQGDGVQEKEFGNFHEGSKFLTYAADVKYFIQAYKNIKFGVGLYYGYRYSDVKVYVMDKDQLEGLGTGLFPYHLYQGRWHNHRLGLNLSIAYDIEKWHSRITFDIISFAFFERHRSFDEELRRRRMFWRSNIIVTEDGLIAYDVFRVVSYPGRGKGDLSLSWEYEFYKNLNVKLQFYWRHFAGDSDWVALDHHLNNGDEGTRVGWLSEQQKISIGLSYMFFK